MTKDANRPATGNQNGGFVVRAPRTTDAIGQSLRHAFDRNQRLPCDLSAMLGALDKIN